MAAFGVHSEIGRLRTALVHRPDISLERVTCSNRAALAFDDVLWVEKARSEHDALIDVIRAQGTEVLYFDALLEQTLDYADARDWLLDRRLHPRRLGPGLAMDTREWLDSLPAKELAGILIGGVTLAELPFQPSGVVASIMRPEDFVLAPLPNQMFARDSSTWICRGATLNPLAASARQGESDNVAAVYHFHPRFEEAIFNIWWGLDGELQGNVALEGGDIMVPCDGKVVLAAGNCTTPQAVAELAQTLLDRRAVEEVIVAKMPAQPSRTHFDLAFTLCSKDLAIIRRPLVEQISSFSIRAGAEPGRLVVERQRHNFVEMMRRVLNLKKLHTVVIDGQGDEDGRWEKGTGVLVVKPGVVITYERNVHTNAQLRDAGIEVLPISASELSRSGGGPQRLVCAIDRDLPAD